jgi:hypothetical protein
MPKISIIIPVYNVAEYLPKCLDSILAQTLSDIEIICINDGSTDNSGDILQNYATKDNRIKIIKQNNQNGKVVAHGYIRSGATYQFDIPDGTYQTFFYYGEGWNPNKEMKGGIKGGFVKDEIFSKDNPQEIYSAVLTYVLQLQRDGNFQTKGSSPDEAF